MTKEEIYLLCNNCNGLTNGLAETFDSVSRCLGECLKCKTSTVVTILGNFKNLDDNKKTKPLYVTEGFLEDYT